MVWLEMSRDEAHGGGEWGFTKSLWSPAYKRGGSTWRFWDLLLEVRPADFVIHLRGKGRKASFIGFSRAATPGFRTREAPPIAGDWGYAKEFNRVLLKDFTPFDEPLGLFQFLEKNDQALRKHFRQNKTRVGREKEELFFVEQAGRLQCLNGAYFSRLTDPLALLLLGSQGGLISDSPSNPRIVKTGDVARLLTSRIGQTAFSVQVRANYHSKCCFPGCPVTEPEFLVGGHVARWADDQDLRGNPENGICLCLMHDKAFELGMFTLSPSLVIHVNPERAGGTPWAAAQILPFDQMPIKAPSVPPSRRALEAHWARIRFFPKN